MNRKINAYYWCPESGDRGHRVTLEHPSKIGVRDFDGVVVLTSFPNAALKKALRDAMWPVLRNDPSLAAVISDNFMKELERMHAAEAAGMAPAIHPASDKPASEGEI